MRALAKRIAKVLFGQYRLIRIYRLDLGARSSAASASLDLRPIGDPRLIEASPDPQIRDRSWYAGEDALAFGLWGDGELVCVCTFWTDRRLRDEAIGKLRDDEAVLVDILTAERARGRGHAAELLRYAEAMLKAAGYSRLVAWVWHSNSPSIRTFEKAGWRYEAFVAELHPLGIRRTFRIRRRMKP